MGAKWAPAIAAAALVWLPNAKAQQPCPFTTGNQGGFNIVGTMVHGEGNQPLGRANVILNSTLKRQEQVYCQTGDDGRFGFMNLPAGKYELSARKAGYRTHSFRQQEGFSTAIVAGPNLDSEHLVFPLHASAKLTGHALDEEGDPVGQATVYLFRKAVTDGMQAIRMFSQTITDPSGNFHFGNLEAGTYFLGVSGRPWYASRGASQQFATDPQAAADYAARNVAYPITYYPDSTNPDSAAPISLTEGGSSEIQITLRATRALHISVEEPRTLGLQNRTMVQVMQFGPGGFPIMVNAETQWNDNKLVVNGVASGHYQVAMSQYGQGPPKALGRKAIDLTGDAKVELSAESDTLSIAGQVTFEEQDGKRHGFLQLANVVTGATSGTQLDSNGTFTFSDGNLVPGRYQFALLGNEGYIKSITVKGAKYSNGILDLAAGNVAQVTIAAGWGRGRVSGVAVSDDKPYAGAFVLLIPQGPNHSSFVGRDQSDSDGSFTIANVPPGRYALIAIDDGRDLAYRDAAALKPYLTGAQELNVTPHGEVAGKVNVMARVR